MTHLLHLRPGNVEKGVIHPHHLHSGLPGRTAGGHRVVIHGAVLRRHAHQRRRVAEGLRVLLVHAQVVSKEDALEILRQPQSSQGGPAVLRHAGGQHDHPLPCRPAPVQTFPDPGLDGHPHGVGVPGHLHPLGHDLFLGLLQMAIGFGEFRGHGKNGVGHALVILPGIRIPPLGQERLVHLPPDPVGINEGAVHVKNQHRCASPWLFALLYQKCKVLAIPGKS